MLSCPKCDNSNVGHSGAKHKCKDCGTMFGPEHKHLPNVDNVEEVVEPIEGNYDNPKKAKKTGQTMSEEALKHLPGKHDQASHAGRGTGGVNVDEFYPGAGQRRAQFAQDDLTRELARGPSDEEKEVVYDNFNRELAAADKMLGR